MTGTLTISTTIDNEAESNLPIHDDISDNLLGDGYDQGLAPTSEVRGDWDTHQQVERQIVD